MSRKAARMKECANCGFYEDGACVCPPYNKWYACPIENRKPVNVQALKDWIAFASKAERQKGGKMGTANDYTHTEGEGKSITYNSSIQSTIGQQKIKGQSTKSDTIYRADAIKAIEDMQDCYNGFSGTYDKAQIIGVLEDVPTAEPQWIPCSERLPEIKEHHVSDTVICYCSNGAYAFSQLQENIFGQCGFECERDDDYHEAVGEVVAWMPLPKPYKGD